MSPCAEQTCMVTIVDPKSATLTYSSPRVQWPDRDKVSRQLARPPQLQHGPARQDLQQGRREGQRALGCRG